MIFSILSSRSEMWVISVEKVFLMSIILSNWSLIGEILSVIACSAISVMVSGERPAEYWPPP